MKRSIATPALFAFMAAALLFAGTTLPANAADIKIATVIPDGSAWMRDMRAAIDDIRTRTDGRVSIKIYAGGIQGNDRRVIRKIRIGQLQGGAFTSNGVAEKYGDIIIYGLALLFNDLDEVDYVRERIDPVLAEGLEKTGFTSFGFAGGGFARLMSNTPVVRLEDLRGQKIWVPEGDRSSFMAMQALSLSPVVLPITDVLTGLETGLLDIVATPPVGAVVLQWYTRTKFVTAQPLSYTLGLLAIDNKVVAALDPADRAVLSEAMTALYARFDAQNRTDNAEAEAALRANGLRFVEPDSAEIPRWRAAAAGAADKLAAERVISAELLGRVRALIAEYRAQAAAPAGAAE